MRLDAVKWLIASHAKVGGTIYHQLPSLRAQLATVPRVQLPTRVLDLRPSSFSSDRLTFEDMRLLISNGETMGHYMTLSHRWGEAHNLELTRENLPAFTKRIEFRHLPRTYEHAVIVARSLGFRYLWIDALCIIQHDEHDWLRESAKMATIYHNASCNIAAHTALDDSHGFLWPNFAQSLADSAIMKRGWVFQERILSKRIIHFARGTSFFEDASGVIKPDGIAPENYDPITNNKMNLEDGLVSQDEWYHLVERFTTCNLTFETDRLPAVAGLSEYYAQQTIDGKYLWGLWSGSFHQGLLWVTTAQDTNELLEGYRAAGMQPPSWSWARWAGKIRY
ncbi:HET-domain-containing protein, partial [Cryphonectria parasitica EP155]